MQRSWVEWIRQSRLGKVILGGSVVGVAAGGTGLAWGSGEAGTESQDSDDKVTSQHGPEAKPKASAQARDSLERLDFEGRSREVLTSLELLGEDAPLDTAASSPDTAPTPASPATAASAPSPPSPATPPTAGSPDTADTADVTVVSAPTPDTADSPEAAGSPETADSPDDDGGEGDGGEDD